MSEKEASIAEHLSELRRRILSSILVFLLCMVLALPFVPDIISRIRTDLLSNYPLIVISPLEAVSVELQVSAIAGFIASLPHTAYQAWAYVSPGLSENEQKAVRRLFLPSVFMFLLGACFAYFLALPVALRFLLDSAQHMATPMLSLSETFSFVLFTVLAFGVVFDMPLFVYALAKTGFVNHETLSSRRGYAIVAICVIAAAITPDPTPVTQILVAVPMIILYEASIALARYAGAR